MLIRWWLNRKKKGSKNSISQNIPTSSDHVIALGTLQFDTRHSLLFREEVKIELTSKEADLLHVLYQNQNKTVNREDLLNSVWGDEGDYVGRTLDVYISKLRKKLEGEPLVKIVNTRGVGYKLILDTPS
jgi:DNA-binding response OmpR family regulator